MNYQVPLETLNPEIEDLLRRRAGIKHTFTKRSVDDPVRPLGGEAEGLVNELLQIMASYNINSEHIDFVLIHTMHFAKDIGFDTVHYAYSDHEYGTGSCFQFTPKL